MVRESLKGERIDLGFDFDLTLGERAVAATAQFDLIGVGSLICWITRLLRPLSHIIAPPVLTEDDLLGAKSDVRPDKYQAWRQLISDLVERDALMQKQKVVALQPEEFSRLEYLKTSRHEQLDWSDTLTAQDASIIDAQGIKLVVHLVAPPAVVADYKLTRLQQFNQRPSRLKAQTGTEENWKLGGAALSVVDRGQNGQDVVGKLIRDNNGDGLFPSPTVKRILEEVGRLPVQDQAIIFGKRFSNFS